MVDGLGNCGRGDMDGQPARDGQDTGAGRGIGWCLGYKICFVLFSVIFLFTMQINDYDNLFWHCSVC